jgi:hypothetical protein
MYDDHVLMGEMAYDFLAREGNATSDERFPGFLGCYPPLPEDAYGSVDLLSPASSSVFYASSPSTTYVPTLARFPKLSNVLSQELPFISFTVALSSLIQSRESPNATRIVTYSRTNLPQSHPRVQPHPEKVVL